MPIEPTLAPTDALRPSLPPRRDSVPCQPCILVLEDDEAVASAAVRALSRAGFNVLIAADGPTAIDLLQTHHIDAAILDYDVPGRNGIEVMERICARQPEAACVLTTGGLDLDLAVMAVNRGNVRRILPKPYSVPALLRVMEESLDLKTRMGEGLGRRQREALARERSQLQACLQDDSLALALQPIVDPSQGEVLAYEALLRSTHTKFRNPLEVLDACERHGLINELGAVVARRAAEKIGRLPPDAKLFINMHPAQLGDVDQLREQMAPLFAHAQRIVVEITERAKLEAVLGWEASVDMLLERKFAFAADDVGAGYNSLALLAQLKPKYIKVDMSIVRNVHVDPARQSLLRLICQFASATDAVVIAEGIEDELERDACVECGAHWLQGYFFGKPSLDI